ncbi:MAG: hypothetical protein DMG07_23860 [Acidobacteria bacterium]|nr:MAG: hypothetical protein DMG07_23860 [Acidobacteriota bacterium]
MDRGSGRRPKAFFLPWMRVLGGIVVLGSCIAAPGRSPRPQPVRPASSRPLVAASMALHAHSEPGLRGLTDSLDLITQNGMNLIGLSADWKDMEPSPGTYAMAAVLTDPLEILVARYPEIDGVVFCVRMIDTFVRSVPGDLKATPFNSPELLGRWDALIDAIAAQPAARRITHLLLGNEVDGYASLHPDEVGALMQMYARGVARVHLRLPGVRVGTITTSFGAHSFPEMFRALASFGDVVVYTHYSVLGGSTGPWKMEPVANIGAQLAYLGQLAEGKPFAFSEIGYASSSINHSSAELDPFRKTGQLEFLLYNNLFDYPPDVCERYSALQQIVPETICSFLASLGLRSYDTGEPRLAWYAFVEGARSWTGGGELPGSFRRPSGLARRARPPRPGFDLPRR